MNKIKVIIGSTRQARLGTHVAPWIMQLIKENHDMEAELIDLRDYPMPFYEEVVLPSQVRNGAYANKVVRMFAAKIAEADGIIILSPEYNHSIPAVLKNALDNVYAEWNKKPLAVVQYGGIAAGTRAAEHLYQIALTLQMVSIPSTVTIPLRSVLDEKFQFKEGSLNQFSSSAQIMLEQLAWWTSLLSNEKRNIVNNSQSNLRSVRKHGTGHTFRSL